MKVLSIILPIYNVEPYIGRCLDSLYNNQNISDDRFEVIAVNDGTIDNSMSKVEEYTQTHRNLRILNKTNGGVSSARNLGISEAVGKYVIFIDPDDTIIPNTLDRITEWLQNSTNTEILHLRFAPEQGGIERGKWVGRFSEEMDYSGVESFRRGYFKGSACATIFLKEFLLSHNIAFPMGIVHNEDLIFMSLCQIYANHVCFLDLTFYSIFCRNDSASRSLCKSTVYSLERSLQYALRLKIDLKHLDYNQKIILEYLRFCIIRNIIHVSASLKEFSYKDFLDIKTIPVCLPIHMVGISRDRNKIALMNISYKVYYMFLCIAHFSQNKQRSKSNCC